MKRIIIALLATAAVAVPYAFGQCTGVFPNNTVCGNTTGSNATPRAISTSGLVAGKALTKADDTNVTLTLSGTPATALLQDVTITAGWVGTLAAARLNSSVVQSIVNDTNIQGSISAQALTLSWASTLSMARGGSAKALTASNGGIVWTDVDSMEVLAGTATAGQMLRSGANATPSWSTATFPATATSTGTFLRADGTNWVASTATIPATATGTGTILRADGTNWVATTATYPNTCAVGQAVYGSAINTIACSSSPAYGTVGSAFSFTWLGSTSGTITFGVSAAAGTYNWNYPTSAGLSGQALTSGGGGGTAMSFAAINLAGGTNIVTGTLPEANGGTGDTGTAWASSNPTIVCGTGSMTSGTATMKMKRIGKTTFINVTIVVTTNGTCANSIGINTSVNSVNNALFIGRNITTGAALTCNMVPSSAAFTMLTDGGAYPVADGQTIACTGVYEGA